METKQEFFITLPSNVKTNSDKNTISNYKTQLKQRLEFPANEDWRVGIKQVTYNRSWFNIKELSEIKFIGSVGIGYEWFAVDSHSKPFDSTNFIHPGEYTISDLIELINNKLSKCTLGTIPKLSYDKNQHVVHVSCGVLNEAASHVINEQFIPVFSEEIENILGLIDNEGMSLADKINLSARHKVQKEIDYVEPSFEAGYFVAPNKVDIDAGFSTIFIYSDVVEQSFVGDAYAQLLAFFPAGKTENWGDVVEHTFSEPDLIKLRSRNFDTIEIDIKDDTGSNIKFERGKFIVKLIFKKYD